MVSLEIQEGVEAKTTGTFFGTFNAQALLEKLQKEISFADGNIKINLNAGSVVVAGVLLNIHNIQENVGSLFHRLGDRELATVTVSWQPDSK